MSIVSLAVYLFVIILLTLSFIPFFIRIQFLSRSHRPYIFSTHSLAAFCVVIVVPSTRFIRDKEKRMNTRDLNVFFFFSRIPYHFHGQTTFNTPTYKNVNGVYVWLKWLNSTQLSVCYGSSSDLSNNHKINTIEWAFTTNHLGTWLLFIQRDCDCDCDYKKTCEFACFKSFIIPMIK